VSAQSRTTPLTRLAIFPVCVMVANPSGVFEERSYVIDELSTAGQVIVECCLLQLSPSSVIQIQRMIALDIKQSAADEARSSLFVVKQVRKV
jgi:hypothetical protein